MERLFCVAMLAALALTAPAYADEDSVDVADGSSP